ncbi:septum formation protein Maf [Reichenbachiella sp. 5M10]|uniref:Maf family nucleotide pyrophosphatase n=1 Tax=Reichenbachiella sp. 5M10 TaxID=1889772 RepID=UPI000C15BAB9|nr:Maf family nucleotide pyrophosphatase [Reichenbachiella sp. 5M10]PIB35846.1 septum formation protein Maf [Reichenbachiella sp. 5M10]
MDKKLILGSNSPRRQQLMSEAGFSFEVMGLDVDEQYGEMPSLEVAEYLAKKKNVAYREVLTDEIVVTADTVVIHEDKVLGKPQSEAEAVEMIQSMSGQVHEVVSAVCISSPETEVSFSDRVRVQMLPLTPEEIQHYVSVYKPMDKAGAYGIQEWIGLIGVGSISGSFYSVVGLPIHRVYHCLKTEFALSPSF